jgi:uncharacterized protein (DUF58 family)
MRLGLVPLSLAVAVSATRLVGAHVTADLLGLLYLTVATVSARRGAELKVAQRA